MSMIDWDFGLLTDTGWFPRRERFDLRTIFVGSVVMGSVAMLVAVPFGLGTAIYLSEYAPRRVRRVVKPIIEVLAGIPSVVVGFFVLNWVAPELVNAVLRPAARRQEHARRRARHRDPRHPDHGDGLRGRPQRGPQLAARGELRLRGAEGEHGRSRVVVPAAVSGIVAASIIAVSRAIGETMVAVMAGGYDGSGPYNGFNPLNPGLSMTAAMTNAAGGTDSTQGGAPFEVLFFVGLLLFVITLGLNLVGDRFVQRVRQKY